MLSYWLKPDGETPGLIIIVRTETNLDPSQVLCVSFQFLQNLAVVAIFIVCCRYIVIKK